MNEDAPKPPREQLETRLTALLLGELPAEDAAALREIMANDAPLAGLYERLQRAIDLVRETAARPMEQTAAQPAPLKLSDERRQKLLAHFKTVAPERFKAPRGREPSWIAPLGAAAALMVLAAISIPNFTRARSTGQANAVINNLRRLDSAKQQWALEKKKSATDVPTLSDLEPYMGRRGEGSPPSVMGETYKLGSVSEEVTADLDAAQARKLFGGLAAKLPAGGVRGELAHLSVNGELTFVDKNADHASRDDRSRRQLEESERKQVTAPAKPASNGANRTEIVLPSGGEFASAANPQFETRSASVDRDAFRQRLAEVKSLAASGAGGIGGGGAGLDGAEGRGSQISIPRVNFFTNEGDVVARALPAESPPVLAPPADAALAFKDSFKNESKTVASAPPKAPVLGDVPALGIKLREDEAAADVAAGTPFGLKPRAAAPTAGDNRLKLGFVNADTSGGDKLSKSLAPAPGQEAAKETELMFGRNGKADQPQTAGRAAGEGGVHSIDAFGDVNMPTNRGTPAVNAAPRYLEERTQAKAVTEEMVRSAGEKAEEALARPNETLKSDQLVEARRLQLQLEDVKRKIDDRAGGVVAGLEAKNEAPPQSPTSGAYLEAKRKLDDLHKARDAIQLRINQKSVDSTLPKTSLVESTDTAQAEPAPSPNLGQRIARTLTGEVERSARIALEEAPSDAKAPESAQYLFNYDPFFIQTEFEKIRSKAVLYKVIEKLNLNEAWAKKHGSGEKLKTEETYQLLGKSLDLRPVPNSSLIDIRVKSDKPDEAARIANTIAEVYRDSRKQEGNQLALADIEKLNEQLAEQDKRIASAREELERLRRDSNSEQADVTPRKPAAPVPEPQPEVQTRDNAFSTFSLNVSDVSFKLAAASLEKSVMPEPANVRSEEFINAFDYRDPEPPPGVPIAFAWERARYPFAHNRDVLRFSIKTAAAGRQPGRPLNLVLLLDNSGSMERADRVQIIHEALRVLAAQLQPQDKLSVVTFARTARLWVDGVPGSQAGEVAEQISGLTPQGGTNLEEAMNLAYQTALRHYLAGGLNRVVLLTDGAANLGNVDPDALKQKVEAHRKQGIALDCFGIGWEGFNDDLLEVLSRNGDGRYGFLNTPEEAATGFAGQLAGALRVAASDVKVQVEFNPARVSAYRQIGYAKHQLTREQFRDNTVDAAEIGAASCRE